MASSDQNSSTTGTSGGEPINSNTNTRAAQPRRSARRESIRWWLMFFGQPLLFLFLLALLLGGVGLGQSLGWLPGGDVKGGDSGEAAESGSYICPMMCTPPLDEPGRCPVCGMELVPASQSGSADDEAGLEIEPAARRIAGIETAEVQVRSFTDEVTASGEIEFDESRLKVVSAHVPGRLEKLFADFTGIAVQTGEPLALLYSPQLYSDQATLLQAAELLNESQLSESYRQQQEMVIANSRTRLAELGMSDAQIDQVLQRGTPASRIDLLSPLSGTVIEKSALEGEYVSAGQPLFRVADLSVVWLTLELFPENAARIQYAHRVEARTASVPGETFTGRVAFVEPTVDPQTRTVGVRVVLENPQARLRVGEFATATIKIPLRPAAGDQSVWYDEELAGKWISPRHPQIISEAPGACPLCGLELVPASEFGFSTEPVKQHASLVVPQNAVLTAGSQAIVYVETEAGKFEMRRVTVGPTSQGQTVILEGLSPGESVATSGNFLIDSQMQLAGKPSLIDPTKFQASPAAPADLPPITERMREQIAKLPDTQQESALQQRMCPVAKMPLGSMGPPIRVQVDQREVFLCCEACRKRIISSPAKYLAVLDAARSPSEADGNSDRKEQP